MKIRISLGCLPLTLTILFIVLKLVGAIKWSWLWVLCPIPIAVVLGVIVAFGIWLGLAWLASDLKKKL